MGVIGTPDDAIAIRPMVYLSLTFDHRILDGATADGFLSKVVEVLGGFAAEQLWVRWPGGVVISTNLPPSAKEVVVDFSGAVRQTR